MMRQLQNADLSKMMGNMGDLAGMFGGGGGGGGAAGGGGGSSSGSGRR